MHEFLEKQPPDFINIWKYLKLVLSHVSDGLFSVRNALVRLEIRHVDVFELLDVLVRDGQVDLGC